MKYSVDRIENDIAVLENIETKEILEIEKKNLPKETKEGTILLFEAQQYKIDKVEEENRREFLKNKFNRLKK